MIQVVEQTDEEKMAMYMKLPKNKLAEMLIQCNKIIDSKSYKGGLTTHEYICTHFFVQKDAYSKVCTHCGMTSPLF